MATAYISDVTSALFWKATSLFWSPPQSSASASSPSTSSPSASSPSPSTSSSLSPTLSPTHVGVGLQLPASGATATLRQLRLDPSANVPLAPCGPQQIELASSARSDTTNPSLDVGSARAQRACPGSTSLVRPASSSGVTETPTLRSCLRAPSPPVSAKSVHFAESRGWNMHRVHPFRPQDRPTKRLRLDEVDLLVPQSGSPRFPQLLPATYQRYGRDMELRWPTEELISEALCRGFTAEELPRCQSCVQVASRGSCLTRYHYYQPSMRCGACLENPSVWADYHAPLDVNEADDELDTCGDDHTRDQLNCQYTIQAVLASQRYVSQLIHRK